MRFKLQILYFAALLIWSAPCFADSAACWNPQGASSLQVSEVDGGDSGAFVREVSKPGYDGIQSCLSVPEFEDLIGGEPQCLYNTECPRSPAEKARERAHPHPLKRTPYLYLGFKSIDNYTVETGLEYEAGCCYIDHNKKTPKDLGKIVYYKQPSFRVYRRNVMDLPPGKLTESNTNIRYIDTVRLFPNDQVCMKSVLDPVSKNFKFHIDARRMIQGKLKSLAKKDEVFPSKIGILGSGGIANLQVRRVTEISTSLNGVTVGGFSNGIQELKNTSLSVTWKNTKVSPTASSQWVAFNQNVIKNGGDAPCLSTVTWPALFTKAPLPNGLSDPRSVGDHSLISYQEKSACEPTQAQPSLDRFIEDLSVVATQVPSAN